MLLDPRRFFSFCLYSFFLALLVAVYASRLQGQATHFPRSGTSAIASGVVFVDMETPSGALNGTNYLFALTGTPVSGSLHFFRNGLLLKSGLDYSQAGMVIVLLVAPAQDDILLASYRK